MKIAVSVTLLLVHREYHSFKRLNTSFHLYVANPSHVVLEQGLLEFEGTYRLMLSMIKIPPAFTLSIALSVQSSLYNPSTSTKSKLSLLNLSIAPI